MLRRQDRLVEKRCSRCGRMSVVRVRARLCRLVREKSWRGTFYCFGQLERGARLKPPKKERTPTHVERPQERAAKMLVRAQTKVRQYIERMRKDAALLYQWQRKAERLARRASMTDDEIVAESTRRSDAMKAVRARRIRRGINLKEM